MSDHEDKPYSFKGHEADQARRWAQLPPIERLRMLQQMKEFTARYLGAASRQASGVRPPQKHDGK